MDTITKNHAKKLGVNFGKLQSAAVLTGVLYAMVFILMIPMYLNQGNTIDSMLKLSGLLVLSALIVHFMLNGMYYLLVALPLIMAGITGVLGWIIWINAPLMVGSITTLVSLFDVDISWMIEYATRIGQTMMFVSGGLWWLVKKGKEIDYAALYIYLIILGMIGVTSGFISPSLSYVFLLFWAVISYKIHEHPTVDTNTQLALIFKIVASLSILIATVKNVSIASNTWYGEMNYFALLYSAIIFLAVSFGIWSPGKFKRLMPKSVLELSGKMLNSFKGLLFVKA